MSVSVMVEIVEDLSPLIILEKSLNDARCQQIIKAAKAIQITTANMAVQAVKRFHISGFFSVNWLS